MQDFEESSSRGETNDLLVKNRTEWNRWTPEVEIQTTVALSTTGGHVWDASHRLLEYLSFFFSQPDYQSKAIRVLELGAGCGWLGLNLAQNFPAASQICLTEQVSGGAMDHLVLNCETASGQHPHLRGAVHVCGCDWAHYADDEADLNMSAEGGSTVGSCFDSANDQFSEWTGELLQKDSKWDVVIGADLVYNEIGVNLLPRVMRSHLHEDSVLLYAHTRGRFEHYDIDFFENISAQGLKFREVREPGVPSPPPSPPPLTEVWRDMRIAIYEITIDTKIQPPSL